MNMIIAAIFRIGKKLSKHPPGNNILQNVTGWYYYQMLIIINIGIDTACPYCKAIY
jgi:hypothetical protein